jgi:hypothetical protein
MSTFPAREDLERIERFLKGEESRHMDPILLILDLDETLFHTVETRPDGAPGIPFDRF